jgi:hypothetical protein
MAARIDDDFMTADHGGHVIATARYSPHAAADGQGACDGLVVDPHDALRLLLLSCSNLTSLP